MAVHAAKVVVPPPNVIQVATAKTIGAWKSGVSAVTAAAKGTVFQQPLAAVSAQVAVAFKQTLVQAAVLDKAVLAAAAAQGVKLSLPAGVSPSGLMAVTLVLLIVMHLALRKRKPRVKSDYVTYRF